MTAKSLTDLGTRFKVDTAQFFHTPETPFEPEKTNLDVYGLVPWVRTGLSGAATNVNADGRAEIAASITLSADDGSTLPVAQTLTLFGPRDVIGIDPRQIVRREPPPEAAVGDSSTLAHIEFDRPEMPWLYTPGTATGDRLKPWIVLVVVEAEGATLDAATAELPARLSVDASQLQPLDDSWAWAHAQVHGSLADASLTDRLGDAYAPQNLSRLLCPRHLEDNRSYIACVVPAFESGRRAGLKLPDGGGLEPAWTPGAGMVILPVYDSWAFTTIASANFEQLAEKLHGVPAPHEVGRRIVDLSTPRGTMTDAGLDTLGAVQAIDCALHSPAPAPVQESWSVPRTEELRAVVNNPALGTDDLPRIGPRIYARFQRGKPVVPAIDAADDWFAAINQNPLDRIAAGLGTRVIQRDQEPLVQAAWAQVGEVEKANRELDRIRFGRYVAEATIAKTLARLELGALAQVVHPVLGKIGLSDGRTAAGAIRTSAMPWAATSTAFRSMVSANGKLSRTAALVAPSVAQATTSPFATLVATAAGLNDMRRAYAEPDAIAGLSAGALATLPVGALAAALNVAPAVALATATARFSNFTPAATQLSAPRGGWHIATTPVDLGGLVIGQRLARSHALELDPATLSPGRREALGGLLATMVTTAPADVAARIDTRLETLSATLPQRTVALGPRVAVPLRLPRAPRRGGPISKVPIGTKAGPVQLLTARERFSKFRTGPVLGPSRTIGAATLADSLSSLIDSFGTTNFPKTPPLAVASQVTKATLLAPLAPALAARKNVLARLGLGAPWLPKTWFDNGQVPAIMAAPHFDRAMYEALEDYDSEWVLANLGIIKQTDFVSLLVSNPRFIEAFMVGLSDEMGRELLWRGYPTDQRGTYFKRFWSPTKDELTGPIHQFEPSKLGDHTASGQGGQVVMLVKGDLIRRYPNAMFMAVEGKGAPKDTIFENPPKPGEVGAVAFIAKLEADTLIVGLDLTLDQVEAVGADGRIWWFMIAEHPSAPRFGLDPKAAGSPNSVPTKLNDLDWLDLPTTAGRFLRADAVGPTIVDNGHNFVWGSDAAAVARMLLQNPVRAAFNAHKLATAAR